MVHYGRDVTDGDYVRLATAAEFREIFQTTETITEKILNKFGGGTYEVAGIKYNGKIILTGGEHSDEIKMYAFPPKLLSPWHREEERDDEISMTDFENIIGVQP